MYGIEFKSKNIISRSSPCYHPRHYLNGPIFCFSSSSHRCIKYKMRSIDRCGWKEVLSVKRKSKVWPQTYKLSDLVSVTLRWVFVSQSNYNQYIFGGFVDYILRIIEDAPIPGDVDDERCILWDNISLHKTTYVTHKTYGCPTNSCCISVDPPLYSTAMAPIEYIFCELASEVARRV